MPRRSTSSNGSTPTSGRLDLLPVSAGALPGLGLPRFDVVELSASRSDPDEAAAPSPPLDPLSVRNTLWTASVRELERVAGSAGDLVVRYEPHDLVKVPRPSTEERLWSFAYPRGLRTSRKGVSGHRTLRSPDLSDERYWQTITLGEFHRQRRFYGLVRVGRSVQCVRTLDEGRMVRIPLIDLRRIAPLFGRMIDPPRSFLGKRGRGSAPGAGRKPGRSDPAPASGRASHPGG